LGEELHRVDMTVESAVRKIERQFHDLNKGGEALTVEGGREIFYLQMVERPDIFLR
jgi:hypothetical protein